MPDLCKLCVIPGLIRDLLTSWPQHVIPGLIRDLIPGPNEMLNQVQHDSLQKAVIQDLFIVTPDFFIVIPDLIRDLLTSWPQHVIPGLIRDLTLPLNMQNNVISQIHRDITASAPENKETICKKK